MEEAAMDVELNNFINLWILAAASLVYCYYISSRLPPGILRLISILPIFYIFTILPLTLTSIHFITISFGFFLFLGSFKLLLLSFDQGHLSQPHLNVFYFIALASLPIKPKQNHVKTTSNSLQQSVLDLLSFAFKLLLLALIFYCTVNFKNQMHPLLVSTSYGWFLYLELDVVLAVSAVPARAILGIEIEPQFDRPYLSTSLQDLWGRRWNLMVSNALRQTVYSPVRRFSKPVLGSKLASLAAILAAFVVSGLVHEALFFYWTRVSPTWEMTWFFFLSGICVVVEVAVKRAVTWQLRPAVSRVLTISFFTLTGHWLFLPPVRRNGVDDRVIGEVGVFATFFTEKIGNLFNVS